MRPEGLRGRRELAAAAQRAELGVGNVALVAEGVAEVHVDLGRVVQRVARALVAQPVAAVAREPQVAGVGMPVEPDRVPHAVREDLRRAAVRVQPGDGGVADVLVGPVADVAGRAHRDVQLAVGPEADELPAVGPVRRESVVHHHRLGRVPQPRLDAVVTQDPVHLGHVERPAAEGDAVRHVQAAGEGQHLVGPLVLVGVEHRVDVAGPARADEQDAGRRPGHRPGVGHVGRVHLDRESLRQGEPVELNLGGSGAGEDGQAEGETADASRHVDLQLETGALSMTARGAGASVRAANPGSRPPGRLPASPNRRRPPARTTASRLRCRPG